MEGLAITSIPACRKPGSGFKIFSGDAVVKGLCIHARLVSSSAAEGGVLEATAMPLWMWFVVSAMAMLRERVYGWPIGRVCRRCDQSLGN